MIGKGNSFENAAVETFSKNHQGRADLSVVMGNNATS